jgi:glycosyltransferase involved in cell wall biosynthesis
VVEVGEPLPIDEGSPRLMRAGLLCEELAAKGHEATWFTSSFNHYRKSMRPTGEFRIEARGSSYQVVTLAATGYQRHVSLQRLRDHRVTAKDLLRSSIARPAPDVICAGLPTLDLADASARIATDRDARLVVDVQDLWPDVFESRVPPQVRRLTKPLFRPMLRQAERACTVATGIVGVSEPFMQWGLDHAGRSRGEHDRVFPLAYQRAVPSDDDFRVAREFWAAKGVTPDRPIAVFVGSMSNAFDFRHVTDAARRLRSTRPDVQFVIAGNGPLRDELERAAADLPNVVVPGWIDGAQIHALLSMAKVGLAPYLPRHDFESNISNKIIEYLSAGLPVVTSLRQGLTVDLLGSTSTGASYDHAADDGLTGALGATMLPTDQWTAISERARRVFEERFDARVVYADYADYLAEVALTRRGS